RAAVALAETQGLSNVSDPSQDGFSVLSGFTHSETHTAWCGDNIVVGFNDTGSFFESLLANAGGVSLNGIALSNDQGASYSDLIFLNSGSNTNNHLGGYPVLGFAGDNNFYYSSFFENGPPSASVTAISVSKST